MNYIVYQITNNLNGKIYIGCHKTIDIDDGYMGSGKILLRAYEKYGEENFTKDILHIFDNSKDMLNKEIELVNESFIARRDTYNLKEGGCGGFDYINAHRTSEQRAEIARKGGLTRHIDKDDWISRISEGKLKSENRFNGPRRVKELYPNGTFHNRKHSKETIAKMSASSKGRGTGKKNSQYGTCWIHNNRVSKKIEKHDLNE